MAKHFILLKNDNRIKLRDELYQEVCHFAPREATITHYVFMLGLLKEQLGGSTKFAPFLDFLAKQEANILANFNRRIKVGKIIFDDLPILFKDGTEIVVDSENFGPHGAIVKSSKLQFSFFGVLFQVTYQVVSTYGGAIKQRTERTQIYSFQGPKTITSLPVRPITAEEKQQFMENGRRYRDFVAQPSHVVCTGNLMVDRGFYGIQKYSSQGRVMVDACAMKQSEPNYFEDGDDSTEALIQKIPDESLWMCESRVFGFSFALKKWGEMALRELSPISYHRDAYDKLVMDEKIKKAVLSLVGGTRMSFSDVIEGKGGGCIFLLHGAPGLGKTMTAEAVADYLGRPLYSVSAGELGVEPKQLEQSLRDILNIAATWDAVILLDEADVYLEQRDERDIVRNAMVGVFLRMLEYHNGVMFLTTNRVRNFDQAFFSRISMTIHYPGMTRESREQVWINLLASAGASISDCHRLAAHDLNGRQIKNVIRAAQALSGRREIDEADLLEAIAVTTQGGKDLFVLPVVEEERRKNAETMS